MAGSESIDEDGLHALVQSAGKKGSLTRVAAMVAATRLFPYPATWERSRALRVALVENAREAFVRRPEITEDGGNSLAEGAAMQVPCRLDTTCSTCLVMSCGVPGEAQHVAPHGH